MSTEQQAKYREILTDAQKQIEEARLELLKIAHDQKVAYRAARMYTYRLQQALKSMKGASHGN